MRLAFAQQYSQADFDEFCKLRRVVKSQGNSQGEKTSALPLLSAHVTYLLTIEAAVQTWNKEHTKAHRDARILRKELAQLAADKNLKPKQLHDVIRRTFGRSQSVSHGRKHFLASNLKTAVNKFFDEGENWFTRGQLLVSKIASEPKLKKQKVVDELRSILSTGELRCKALRGLLNREEAFETAKRKKSGGGKNR